MNRPPLQDLAAALSATLGGPRRGMLFVLSSPSGGGKGAVGGWLRQTAGMVHSVSATTRPPRPGEREGIDYYFLTPEAFEARVAEGRMLEHAEVFGNRYGTPREPVAEWLAQGRDVLFDIDWQGARQLRAAAPEDVASVYLLPPSMAVLAQRLRARGQDSEEVIERRMRENVAEIAHWREYDYVVINESLDIARAQTAAILAAERLRRQRRLGIESFVREVLE